jgi:hypothetical protein
VTAKIEKKYTTKSSIGYAYEDNNYDGIQDANKPYDIYYILIPICAIIVVLVIAIIFALKKIISIVRVNKSLNSFSKPDLPSIVIAKNSIPSELSDTSSSTLDSHL